MIFKKSLSNAESTTGATAELKGKESEGLSPKLHLIGDFRTSVDEKEMTKVEIDGHAKVEHCHCPSTIVVNHLQRVREFVLELKKL